ncbi:hypothetical protein A2470_02375 [Candidatus Curtissbacteria bacterium RIFOXYC2_FULL_41_11]|nr:MAG: Pseudouridine synthase [Candidatus Curtissbacteria bacterium GW2011_GWC2_41_21]OGD92279.1 MAG: hypothetical protein A3E14_03350 [Candidatus Curtissbacteria bacterium RIFCSPHIGHO2_12_FULL_41_13]OGE11565.1 MAG: hypothetical protein A2470_02375 [Candidatus Curtissbacteria bacterium RIFOXYC2_FULL_41_11]OGE12521.1 MAG: hypothetical protein A2305_02095 [Candidatus Curtissbacteria bacterium RIFOXYB2_FULL_41_10]OGE16402.1 MAG: hypothetical protein A2495_02745 [Candidatus Curtissbacteria bacteri
MTFLEELMLFKVIFEDEQILVVDKPAGLVVNRSETNRQETLQDQLVDYFKLGHDLGIGDRAGIVHRLDRETSGVLVVAKTQKAFDFLQKQFKDRKIKKEYVALVHGFVKEKTGSVVGDIGRIGRFGKFGVVDEGRESRTDYEVQEYYQHRLLGVGPLQELTKSRVRYLQNHAKDYTLLHLFPKTGRTHQVRVHLKSIGHSVVSDTLYAPAKLLKFDKTWCPRLFLHAQKIEFENLKHRQVVFEAQLPYDLIKAQANLNLLPDV